MRNSLRDLATLDDLQRGDIIFIESFRPFTPDPNPETRSYVPTPPTYSLVPGVPYVYLSSSLPFISCVAIPHLSRIPAPPESFLHFDFRCVQTRLCSLSYVLDFLLHHNPQMLSRVSLRDSGSPTTSPVSFDLATTPAKPITSEPKPPTLDPFASLRKPPAPPTPHPT